MTTGAALRELVQVFLLVCFMAGAGTFLVGLGLLGVAHLAGAAAPGWAPLARNVGAIGMGFCMVGGVALYILVDLCGPAPEAEVKKSEVPPKDAA